MIYIIDKNAGFPFPREWQIKRMDSRFHGNNKKEWIPVYTGITFSRFPHFDEDENDKIEGF